MLKHTSFSALLTNLSACAALTAMGFTPFQLRAQCDSTLWNHVYNSYRLHINNPCITVSGTVYSMSTEADGDIHIRLTVDSPYTYMLNAANYSGEYGKLVCEPVCVVTVTQADAVASCANFTNAVYIPSNGEHVYITGPYVTDNDHGWNEIHPITKISFTADSATAVTSVTSVPVQVTEYPNPADAYVNFKLSSKPGSPVYITILDEVGRLGGQFQMLETTSLRVPTRYFMPGIYYYHIEQSNKEIQNGKFVIEH